MGSSISSQTSGRIQKLSSNSNGINVPLRLLEDSESPSPSSSIITYKEISLEDACSPSQSNSNSAEINERAPLEKNVHFHPYAHSTNSLKAIMNGNETTSETQERYQRRDQAYGNSDCCSSNNSPVVVKSEVKPRILLADDNKINVMVAKSMMKQLGHNIDVVNNGAEAVRAVQGNCYDLVLIDICMPVMDGLQATRLIRSFEETGNWEEAVKAGVELQLPPENSSQNTQEENPVKRIPIIAMTANSLSESADDCFSNGMDSFVSKPVTFQNLKQCLRQYLP